MITVARKPKRGRYTPPNRDRRGPSNGRGVFGEMGLTSARIGAEDSQARDTAEREFFRDTIFPEQLTLLRPTTGAPGEDAPADPGATGMLVALVGRDDFDADTRRLFDARAAEVDALRWNETVEGQVGPHLPH